MTNGLCVGQKVAKTVIGHRPFNKVGLSTFKNNVGTKNPGCYAYFMRVASGPSDRASCVSDCFSTYRRRFVSPESIGGLCKRRGIFHCLPLGDVVLHLFPRSASERIGVVSCTSRLYEAPLAVDFSPSSSHATTLARCN